MTDELVELRSYRNDIVSFLHASVAGASPDTGAPSKLEDKFSERDERVPDGVESPRTVPASHEAGIEPGQREVTARDLSPNESPLARAPASSVQSSTARLQAGAKEHRAGFLRGRPVASAIGAVLLASAIAGGYIYMDQARHFESTDDAFIAARQFSLAPKVSYERRRRDKVLTSAIEAVENLAGEPRVGRPDNFPM